MFLVFPTHAHPTMLRIWQEVHTSESHEASMGKLEIYGSYLTDTASSSQYPILPSFEWSHDKLSTNNIHQTASYHNFVLEFTPIPLNVAQKNSFAPGQFDICYQLHEFERGIITEKNDIRICTDSRIAPNQWETSLESNTAFYRLCANLKSAQEYIILHV